MSSSVDTDPSPPSYADIADAARRISAHGVETPLLESPALNRRLGGRLFIKAECLQRTGSFKFRGAYNRLSRIAPDRRAAGVVAFSSGNHAQGVAYAAALLEMRATIVMPADAPAIKIANTKGYGAEIVPYDRKRDDREAICARIAGDRGATIVPPYDDPMIIAGQGTVGIEIARQAERQGVILDAVAAPASGGGLVAGIALALAHDAPGLKVYCGEPANFDDHARSLAQGQRATNAPGASSICDALLAATPGIITFAVNRRLLAGGIVADDDSVRRAMATAFAEFKLVVEPGGAVALAAVLDGLIPIAGRAVAVVCSGGNVDPETFIAALRTMPT